MCRYTADYTVDYKDRILVESTCEAYGVDAVPLFEYWKWNIPAVARQHCAQFKAARETEDGDHDGYSPLEGDDDDNDATVHPGAPELDDGKDNNCNGLVDEAVLNKPELVRAGRWDNNVHKSTFATAEDMVCRRDSLPPNWSQGWNLPVKAPTPTPTRADCAGLCTSVAGCQALRYHASTQTCQLKTNFDFNDRFRQLTWHDEPGWDFCFGRNSGQMVVSVPAFVEGVITGMTEADTFVFHLEAPTTVDIKMAKGWNNGSTCGYDFYPERGFAWQFDHPQTYAANPDARSALIKVNGFAGSMSVDGKGEWEQPTRLAAGYHEVKVFIPGPIGHYQTGTGCPGDYELSIVPHADEMHAQARVVSSEDDPQFAVVLPPFYHGVALPAAPEEYDCANARGASPAECEALVVLFRAARGSAWKDNHGWLRTGDVCEWHGVTCDKDGVSALAIDDLWYVIEP